MCKHACFCTGIGGYNNAWLLLFVQLQHCVTCIVPLHTYIHTELNCTSDLMDHSRRASAVWKGMHEEERQEYRSMARHAKCDMDSLSLQQKRKKFEGCLKRMNNEVSHIHDLYTAGLVLDLLCITDA